MKMTYTLKYREYGKTKSIIIEAKSIYDAEIKAKEFCVENVITFAYLLTKSGKSLNI